MNSIYFLLAGGAGACIALQAAANGKFRSNLSDPIWAAFLSICGTSIVAAVTMLILRPATPSEEAFKSTQWWNWIGGPLGALIVLSGAALIPKLGAAPFLAFVIGGQLICSVLLDHFALLGLQEARITLGRLAGVVLIVAGVICVKFL